MELLEELVTLGILAQGTVGTARRTVSVEIGILFKHLPQQTLFRVGSHGVGVLLFVRHVAVDLVPETGGVAQEDGVRAELQRLLEPGEPRIVDGTVAGVVRTLEVEDQRHLEFTSCLEDPDETLIVHRESGADLAQTFAAQILEDLEKITDLAVRCVEHGTGVDVAEGVEAVRMFPHGFDTLRVAGDTVEIHVLRGAQRQQYGTVDTFHIHAMKQHICRKRTAVQKDLGELRKVFVGDVA